MSDIPLGLYVLLILALLGLQALFTASEIAFFATGVVRARQRAEEGSKAARILLRLLDDRPRLVTTVLVSITGLLYAAETLATILGHSTGAPYGELIAFLGVSVIALSFADVTPALIAAREPERTALFLAPLVGATQWALGLIVAPISRISSWIVRTFGGVGERAASVTEDEILSMIDESEAAGEKVMLRRIFLFGERTVGEIMVPRADMVCVEADAPVSEALHLTLESRHSRLPVYRERRDQIVGILYAKDLLPALRRGENQRPVGELVRPAYFVPESKPADELLREFQMRRRLMAVVVDEFGGVAGIITLEDLLEEIVGEIFDEYDVEEPSFIRTVGNFFLIRGKTPIHQVNEELGLRLPENGFETFGGFILSLLGRLPAVGEKVSFEDRMDIEILEIVGHRISLARVRLSSGEPPEPREAPGDAPGPAASKGQGIADG